MDYINVRVISMSHTKNRSKWSFSSFCCAQLNTMLIFVDLVFKVCKDASSIHAWSLNFSVAFPSLSR